MNIFDVVGENFFKPLTSQFKTIYLDCLTIIYDSYRSELSYGIDREILVSKLSDYFERSNISDIEFEDESEILKDSRSKATTFLRKLKDFGWVEYEISNNQMAKIIMPDYAVTVVKTFLDISNPKEMEYYWIDHILKFCDQSLKERTLFLMDSKNSIPALKSILKPLLPIKHRKRLLVISLSITMKSVRKHIIELKLKRIFLVFVIRLLGDLETF